VEDVLSEGGVVMYLLRMCCRCVEWPTCDKGREWRYFFAIVTKKKRCDKL
jgi:hypothetical protein